MNTAKCYHCGSPNPYLHGSRETCYACARSRRSKPGPLSVISTDRDVYRVQRLLIKPETQLVSN